MTTLSVFVELDLNVQVITLPDQRYEAYCNSSDFIRDHIFPGGHLPSMGAMLACAGCESLSAVNVRDVGPDYAITLRAWRKNWMSKWDEIRALGYSDRFMRKYAIQHTSYRLQWFVF